MKKKHRIRLHYWKDSNLQVYELEFDTYQAAMHRLNKLKAFPTVDYHNIKLFNDEDEVIHEEARTPSVDQSTYA